MVKATGTGKTGQVKVQASSGIGADQPDPVTKPVNGVKAVTAESTAPVMTSSSAAIGESGLATATPNLVNLAGLQAAAIATGAPLAADVARETAGNPQVTQQVVQGRNVAGMAGLGAAYPNGGNGAAATVSAFGPTISFPKRICLDGLTPQNSRPVHLR